MISTVFKGLVVIAAVLVITGLVGLLIMAGVAGTHGVVPIPVPSYSYIANHVTKPDYVDCYRVPLEFATYTRIDSVAAHAYKGDREVYRDEREVVYEGDVLGLRYYRSFILDRTTDPATLSVANAILYREEKGRRYWKVIRPIHRRLSPFMLDRMAQSAPN